MPPRSCILALCLVSCLASGPCGQQAAAGAKAITLEHVLGGSTSLDFRGRAPRVRWDADGVNLRVDGGEPIDPGTGAKAASGTEAPVTAAPHADDLAALVASGVDQAEARLLLRRARPAGAGASYAQRGEDLWFWKRGGPARRLTDDGVSKRIVQASPTGRHMSFVRGGNLVLIDTASGEEWSVADDGSGDVLYGVLDWVYQEEVYGRGDYRAHWWNGDGSAVAFLRLDQAKVKDFVVIDFIVRDKSLDEERHVRPMPMKYPKAGDDNPTVKLGVARPAERRVQWVDLTRFPGDALVVHVGFTPSGDRLVFQVQDRVQTWLELCYADLASGAVTTILRASAAHGWVNRLDQPHWLTDGSFLWLTERTGKKTIEHREADGGLRRVLTAAPVVVSDLVRVDEEQNRVWFSGHDGRAVDRHLFTVALDGSAPARRLTRESGTHSASLDAAGTFFLDTFSSVTVPTQVRLCDGDGKVLRTFEGTPPRDLAAYGYVAPELFTVTCRDGCELDASLVKPSAMDPSVKHPIWIETYSGPDAPSVRNAWSASTWTQFLQRQGIVVLQVNVRSASGKGQDATAACYERLGVQELMDLEDAVAQVCANPWADGERVGLTGWSFGGTMTAFALTHSRAFALGIAGAGVYDWRLYDTIYTERYMNTPQANPAGYAQSSVIGAAKDLHGHLLLLHGTDDDNVHLQNTMQLAYALQRAGKDFAMMLYPTAMHGVRDPSQGRHMRRLMWKTIEAHLLR
ncbi:MAG: DPP IV N-terminal domain-containing protein [Planctomycetota bacterium]